MCDRNDTEVKSDCLLEPVDKSGAGVTKILLKNSLVVALANDPNQLQTKPPAETETNEIFVRKTELSNLTVLGMKVPEERTEMQVKVVDHMEARDMITLDKDSGVEMAYWAKDIFVQDPQAGVQDTQAGLQDTQDGAQDVEVAQVQKKMVK